MTNPVCVRHVEYFGHFGHTDAAGGASCPCRRIMAKDKILILAIFALIIGVAVGIQQFEFGAPSSSTSGLGGSAPAKLPARKSPPPPPLKELHVDQFRGFTLQLQSASPTCPYEKYIDEIAATGSNAICLSVAGYQENCASTSIFIDARRSPSTDRIKALIGHARQRKLQVMLMPLVLLENPRSGEWRGKIEPRDWDDWWEDYDNFMLHYARVAQDAGVEILAVGSELISTEKDHADRWRGLIASVRKTYKGYLIYSANWDHFRPVSWWDAVDIVGMTTYYDLTSGKQPTVERLMKNWKPLRQDILGWQKTIGRPIMFTEVGWPNQVTCAQYPWDYTRSPDKPDPDAQANCFEAFFGTWIREPSIAGFLVWEWRNYPGQVVDPKKDTGYVPCGKPAMAVIEKYYRMPDPSTRPAPATTPASSTKPAAATSTATAPATTPDSATTPASRSMSRPAASAPMAGAAAQTRAQGDRVSAQELSYATRFNLVR